jgi:hypothetical protein
LKTREEIDDKYVEYLTEEKKKKADIKVIESRKKLSDEEVRKIILDMVAKKKTIIDIRIHLEEERDVPQERVNDMLIDIVRVISYLILETTREDC